MNQFFFNEAVKLIIKLVCKLIVRIVTMLFIFLENIKAMNHQNTSIMRIVLLDAHIVREQ